MDEVTLQAIIVLVRACAQQTDCAACPFAGLCGKPFIEW